MVLATAVPTTNAATKLKNAAQNTATPGREDPGGDDGRDGVGAVVEAVDEVEEQRDADDGEDEPDGRVHDQACLMKMDSSTLATSSA